MSFSDVIGDLTVKYNGRLYCDELLDTIVGCTDNNVFLTTKRDGNDFVINFLYYYIIPDVFHVLRDTIYRNANNYEEAQEVLGELFIDIKIAGLVLFANLELARVIADIVPFFDELVTESIKDRTIEESLFWRYTEDHTKDPVKNITDKLPEIDFIVQHSTMHENFLVRPLWHSSLSTKCILSYIESNIYEWAPYLVKWIINSPRLLEHPSLDNYREDLVRLLLEKESELSQDLLSIIGTEETSIQRIVATVLGDQTGLIAHRSQRK